MKPDNLLSGLSTAVASETSFEGLVRQLLTLLELATDLESTYLTKIDLQASIQSILFSRNSKDMTIPEGLSVPWGDTLCKRALDEGRVYTDDVAGCWGDSDAARTLGIMTYASTPVRLDDGSLYGTLCAASSTRKPMTERGQQVLQLFAKLIAQQIEKEKLVEDLRAANEALRAFSYTDTLTGLPNRRAFTENLGRQFALARRNHQSVLLSFIDLDGFKQINDRFGHDSGDAFLVEIGRRLSAGIRGGDILGRLGGDEFVVSGIATTTTTTPAEATEILKARLQAMLRGDYKLPRVSLHYLGASIGTIAVDPAAVAPDQALHDADAAMYRDKQQRREQKAGGFHVNPA